jgi:hypothetical protein
MLMSKIEMMFDSKALLKYDIYRRTIEKTLVERLAIIDLALSVGFIRREI